MAVVRNYYDLSDEQIYGAAPTEEPTTEADKVANESTIVAIIKKFTSIASVMRILGAMTVIAAMSAFLIQDWASGNDMSRFYLLLSQTLLLAAGGFGLSYLLKENKGARVFFGLGLISITVNMATLGALIFSVTQWGSTLVEYPGFVKWVAADFSSITMALGGALLVGAPVAMFSYMVLVRRSAKTFIALSLFTNLLLLFPVRESFYLGAVAILAILVPLWFIRQRVAEDNTLRTAEGWFAIASIFIPAVIILLRSLWLYPTDDLLQITLSAIGFVGLRFCAPHTDKKSVASSLMNLGSLVMAFCMAIPVAQLTAQILPETFAFTAFGAVLAVLLLDIAQRSDNPVRWAKFAAMFLAGSHITPVVIVQEPFSGVLCVVAGLAIIAMGHRYAVRNIMVLGTIVAAFGALDQVTELVMLINFSSWITLAILGASTIVTASVIERHGAIIKLKWDELAKKEVKKQAA